VGLVTSSPKVYHDESRRVADFLSLAIADERGSAREL
jgi:hypothetical protein